MILGVLNEHPDNRVALVPQVAKKIKDLGIEIVIEKDAGVRAGFVDDDYSEFAAVSTRDDVFTKADIVITVNQPGDEVLDKVKNGCKCV